MKHRKTSRRWPHAIVAAALTFGTIGLTSQVQAASATPAPVCSNGLCKVTFDYTGDFYVYTPPSGIRSMSFEVFGAQGGRSGGLGGKVVGTFSTIPTSMNIFVGGAGKTGSLATGGYNGGGQAGSGHGDEGSGGGASDIRLASTLDDRIVVAGGGGGAGGWVGLAGAPGGGLIASAGSGSSPAGGGGGTQLAGGAGGAGSSGNSGSAGSKGQGGSGGGASIGGGGGGGAGYFGGGGGGGDGVPSGTDGAGGGGGSSFASANYTKSVVHTSGARAGNGQVILTYAYSPSVLSFAPVSNSGNQLSVTYNLGFSQSVGGLDAADFSFSGSASGCSVSNLTGSASSYQVTISGCADGTVSLVLAADSVTGATLGPSAPASAASISLDRRNPTFTVTAPANPTNQASIPFVVRADEPVTGLTTASFEVAGVGCRVDSVVASGTTFTVSVGSCQHGTQVALTLKALSATDSGGNSGPLAPVASSPVSVDLEVPTPTTLVTNPNTRSGLIGFDFTLNEPATGFTDSAISVRGQGCQLSKVSGEGAAYTVWLTGYAQGVSAGVTLLANSLSDTAGNLGPMVNIDSPVVLVDDAAPTAQWDQLPRASQTFQPVFELNFSEPVSGFSADSLSHSGSSTGCKFASVAILAGISYRVTASGCSAGNVRLELLPGVVVDSSGNLGPIDQVVSDLVTIDKTPVSPVTNFAAVKKPKAVKKAVSATPTKIVPRPVPHRSTPVRVTKPQAETITTEVTPLVEGTPPNKSVGLAALFGACLLTAVWVANRKRAS
ncbi:MAG: hypothetical protein RL510_337 [Actinomycetota bacterium]